jgi:hypothetical protein
VVAAAARLCVQLCCCMAAVQAVGGARHGQRHPLWREGRHTRWRVPVQLRAVAARQGVRTRLANLCARGCAELASHHTVRIAPR